MALQTCRLDDIIISPRKRHLDPAKVAELAGSIAEIGLLQPVLLREDGQLIAGRHRIEAYRSLGLVEIEASVLEGLSALGAELAEIDENLIRADLRPLERGEHWARRKEVYEALHPETRAGVAGGLARQGTATEMISFADDASGKTGQTSRSVRHDVQIATSIPEVARDAIRESPIAENKTELLELARLHKNHPEEAEAVVAVLAAGDTQHLGEARKQVKRERKQAEAKDFLATVGASDEKPYDIRIGDFRSALADLPDESVALIFTDPPWDDATAEDVYEDLFTIADSLLVEGGSLITYVGHNSVPTVLAFENPLRYWWQLAEVFDGGPTPRLPGKYVLSEWRPLLWFVKGGRRNSEYLQDCFRCPLQEGTKEHHEWERPELTARLCIEHLTSAGETVLDPFLGGGTTGAAAVKLQRRFIGCDVDRDALQIATARIAADV